LVKRHVFEKHRNHPTNAATLSPLAVFLGMGEKRGAIDCAVGVWNRTQDRMNLTGLIREDFKTMPDVKRDGADQPRRKAVRDRHRQTTAQS
jgi:hypothetical protein